MSKRERYDKPEKAGNLYFKTFNLWRKSTCNAMSGEGSDYSYE